MTTEADLEAAISNAIRDSFPFASMRVSHQKTFSVRVGRTTHTVGSTSNWAKGRADVLLELDDRSLAILELKKPGHPITEDDAKQGLSYARLLDPSAPFVVVSNGDYTKLYTTLPFEEIDPIEDETGLSTRFANAALIASNDRQKAVSSLLGTDSAVWLQLARDITSEFVEENSGELSDPEYPFARAFLVPRRASDDLTRLLDAGERLLLLEGGPLSGKTSVLRDLATRVRDSTNVAVLILDASATDPLQLIADLLSDRLNWDISPDQARRWLLEIARRKDGLLVLAIDNLDFKQAVSFSTLERLTGGGKGKGLAIVATCADSVRPMIERSSSARQISIIGKRSTFVSLEPLDGEELAHAEHITHELNISWVPGYQYCQEYRLPWVLRHMIALVDSARPSEEVRPAIPPLLGTAFVRFAEERSNSDLAGRLKLRKLAKLIMSETAARAQKRTDTVLLALTDFLIAGETLEEKFEADDIDVLIRSGMLKIVAPSTEQRPHYVVRLPEYLLPELAILLQEELAQRSDDPWEETAAWLVSYASSLPFGDVIGASAIERTILSHEAFNGNIILSLANRRPQRRPVPEGFTMGMAGPDGEIVEISTLPNGKMRVTSHGTSTVADLGDEGFGDAISDHFPWLMLSHIARIPAEIVTDDGAQRIDAALLAHLGSYDGILVRPSSVGLKNGFPIHEMPDGGSVVCRNAGVVEAITWNIAEFLVRGGEAAEAWIDDICKDPNQYLIARSIIALGLVASFSGSFSDRAGELLSDRVLPISQSHGWPC